MGIFFTCFLFNLFLYIFFVIHNTYRVLQNKSVIFCFICRCFSTAQILCISVSSKSGSCGILSEVRMAGSPESASCEILSEVGSLTLGTDVLVVFNSIWRKLLDVQTRCITRNRILWKIFCTILTINHMYEIACRLFLMIISYIFMYVNLILINYNHIWTEICTFKCMYYLIMLLYVLTKNRLNCVNNCFIICYLIIICITHIH